MAAGSKAKKSTGARSGPGRGSLSGQARTMPPTRRGRATSTAPILDDGNRALLLGLCEIITGLTQVVKELVSPRPESTSRPIRGSSQRYGDQGGTGSWGAGAQSLSPEAVTGEEVVPSWHGGDSRGTLSPEWPGECSGVAFGAGDQIERGRRTTKRDKPRRSTRRVRRRTRSHHSSTSQESSGGEILDLATGGQEGRGFLRRGVMETWEQLILQGVLNSLAPSTRRAYSKACSAFLAFLKSRTEYRVQEPSERLVLEYLTWLHRQGYAPSTMKTHLAAISFCCKVMGWADPTKSFLARRAVAGWFLMKPSQRDTRRPITGPILQGLLGCLPSVCQSRFEAALFRAAFTLAFNGAFRVGELVAESASDQTGRALAVRDVVLGRKGVQVWIQRSNTGQKGQGAFMHLDRVTRGAPCPVRALRAFLDIRPRVPGQLLVHADGSFLTRFQFTAMLKASLEAAGFPAREFGCRSFRIG